jgi:hypothetical protein
LQWSKSRADMQSTNESIAWIYFFYILTILLLEVKVFDCFSKTRVRLHIEHTACHDVPSWNLKEMAITHVIASY